LGAEATVLACLSGVLAGTVLRSAGPPWLVLVGTGIIGLAITLGNIVVPVIIRREVPWEQVSMVTGLYSAMMNIGSMATLIGTGPLAAALGWRWALVTWGVLALIGLGFWIVLIRFRVRREGAAVQGAEEASSEPETEQPWSQAPAAFRGIIA